MIMISRENSQHLKNKKELKLESATKKKKTQKDKFILHQKYTHETKFPFGSFLRGVKRIFWELFEGCKKNLLGAF